MLFASACLAVFALTPSIAHAYIDPGTGGMFFQMIAAGIIGALFAIKTFWYGIVLKFKQLFGIKTQDSAPSDAPPADDPTKKK